MLQCVAVRCGVLQRGGASNTSHQSCRAPPQPHPRCTNTRLCCSVLQRVAVCCSELQWGGRLTSQPSILPSSSSASSTRAVAFEQIFAFAFCSDKTSSISFFFFPLIFNTNLVFLQCSALLRLVSSKSWFLFTQSDLYFGWLLAGVKIVNGNLSPPI